jgi:hypothetical protein
VSARQRIAIALVSSLAGCGAASGDVARAARAPGVPGGGGAVGVGVGVGVAAERRDDTRSAYGRLRAASRFESGGVGLFAEPSETATAFREVASSAQAEEQFRTLAREATPAGRVYALAGLYLVDAPDFLEAAKALWRTNEAVTIASGCAVWTESVRSLVDGEGSLRVPRGATVHATLASHLGGACDVTGGCLPLLLAADGRPAPRDPVMTMPDRW